MTELIYCLNKINDTGEHKLSVRLFVVLCPEYLHGLEVCEQHPMFSLTILPIPIYIRLVHFMANAEGKLMNDYYTLTSVLGAWDNHQV